MRRNAQKLEPGKDVLKMGMVCDRCRVPGCLLNYMGVACKNARAEQCPDVVQNHFENITESWTEEDFIEALGGNSLCSYIQDHDKAFCEARATCEGCLQEWLASPSETLPSLPTHL